MFIEPSLYSRYCARHENQIIKIFRRWHRILRNADFLNMTHKELLVRGKTDKSGYINFKIHSFKDTVK